MTTQFALSLLDKIEPSLDERGKYALDQVRWIVNNIKDRPINHRMVTAACMLVSMRGN